jgi:8-oxo-dGTP pyrophosphatase MutT (NUDIX family)
MREKPTLRTRLASMATPAMRAWWRLSRPMTLGARGLALDGEGRVLLVRHTYRPGWYLPGGGVEPGESVVDAAIREMAEEGGVAAQSPPRLFGLYRNLTHRDDHVAFYRFDDWLACAPKDNGEIAERGFFARDALPEDATHGTRRRLDEVFAGAPLSPDW